MRPCVLSPLRHLRRDGARWLQVLYAQRHDGSERAVLWIQKETIMITRIKKEKITGYLPMVENMTLNCVASSISVMHHNRGIVQSIEVDPTQFKKTKTLMAFNDVPEINRFTGEAYR